MRKTCWFYLAIFSLLSLFRESAAGDSSNDVTIAFNAKPPFFYFQGDHPKGLVVERISAALDATGIHYHFEELPFQRLLYYLEKSQRNFVVLGLSRSAERESFSIFSAPIFKDQTPVVLIRREDYPRFAAFHSLAEVVGSGLFFGRKVGTVHTADPILKGLGDRELFFDGEVKEFPKLLVKKRFDFTILYPEEVEFAVEASGVDGRLLEAITYPDMPEGNFRYLLFGKKFDPHILERINSALERLPPQ